MDSDDRTAPVTMAALEASDPRLASQVRRARRRQESENIMNLAREAQQQLVKQRPAPRPSAPAPATGQESEPIWR